MKIAYSLSQTFLLVFVISFITSCNGQIDSDKHKNHKAINQGKIEKIDQLISLYAYNEGFSGSVLVAHEGEVVYKNGFGMANMEWDIPNAVDTKFRIASVTKPFTAVLVMQLVAENKLDLNEPISTYIEDYPKENGDQITIHHLLTHSSGIIRDVDSKKNTYYKPKDLVAIFANEPLQFIPGKKFAYSNAGYILLGHLIEVITGKRYKEVLEDKIFKPLNMKNSGYYRHRLLLENRSSGYNSNFIEYYNSNYRDFSTAFSGGAIYSTVEDMFLFDQALYRESLLPQKYLDLSYTKHVSDDKYGGFYGYGWELIEKSIGNTDDKIETISHSGSLPGYCAVFTRIPESKTTVILLNNTGRAYLNAITKAVTGILHDKTYKLPKKSAAKSLLNIIEKDGIDQGIQLYNKIENDDAYYTSEEEMNILSYKYLRTDKPEVAVAVLELAIQSFPNAFNLYDSYGEVLLKLGKKEKAIENYKKSVALNPNNKNGIKILQDLEVE